MGWEPVREMELEEGFFLILSFQREGLTPCLHSKGHDLVDS